MCTVSPVAFFYLKFYSFFPFTPSRRLMESNSGAGDMSDTLAHATHVSSAPLDLPSCGRQRERTPHAGQRYGTSSYSANEGILFYLIF